MSAMKKSIGEEQEDFIYLNIFNLTTITNVKRMHHEQEHDRLEDGPESVAEHEDRHEKLRAQQDEEL